MERSRAGRELALRYRLERILKSGSGATTLRAVDQTTGRPVAVKMLNPGADPAQLDRFEALATALADIDQPTLPAVVDWGTTSDGFAFLVSEWVDGRSYAGLAGTSHRRIASLATQALGGIEALGARGFAHGNLAPDNLMVEVVPTGGQRLRLVGLGTASFRRPGAPDPSPNARYRAPEEAAGGPPTLAGDLYSIARTLAEVLGAEIGGEGGPAPSVSLPFSFEIERAEVLRSILEACLKRDPQERPHSADEVRRALRSALGKGLEAEPPWVPRERPAAPPIEPPAPAPAPMPAAAFTEPIADERPEDLLDKTQPVEARPLPEIPEPPIAHSGVPDKLASAVPSALPPLALPPLEVLSPRPAAEALRAEAPLAAPPVSTPPPPTVEVDPTPSGSLLPDIDFEALAPRAGETSSAPVTPTAPAAPDRAPERPPQTAAPLARAAAAADRPPLPWRKIAGIGAAAVALAAVGVWLLRPAPTPAPAEPPPAQIPTAPAKEPALARLEAAKRAVGEGDYGRAREILAGLDTADQASLPAAACRQLQALEETIPKMAAESLPRDLAAALDRGDVEAIRRTLGAASDPALLAGGPPELAANLDSARQIVRLYEEAESAAKTGASARVLERFAVLSALLPPSSPAFALRDKAAAAIEAEAAAHAANGEYPQAVADLSPLVTHWPARPGLKDTLAAYQRSQALEGAQEAFLESVPRYLSRRRPDEGLAELRKHEPTPHLAARFADAERQLTEMLARIDAQPPTVEISGGYDSQFFRGTVANLGFRATDDFRVADVEISVIPRGGRARRLKAEKVGVRYEVAIPPSIHGNEAFEVVAVATDLSGHQGRLSVRLTRVGSNERLVR